jgi:hypothetical protein
MFVWDERSKRTPSAKQLAARRDEMYRRELEDRAALLLRLGYPAERTKARLHANVRWDFEMRGTARHVGDIDKIVDQVYRRGGGSGPPTV